MEQNKFDEHIKANLESRRLQPSNNAWNKLSTRLEAEDKKPNRNTFWYVGIAASVAGLLFVAFQFYNTKPTAPVIVDTPTVKQKNNTQVTVDDLETSRNILEKTEAALPVYKFKVNAIEKGIEPVVALESGHMGSKEKSDVVKPNKELKEPLTFEEQKIQDVVAKVQDLKSKNQEVSDAVIDALLLEAQKEIKLKQLFDTSTGIVDANKLLREVETDLDQSFRSKVFEAIKSSFSTVKTVVAQRND